MSFDGTAFAFEDKWANTYSFEENESPSLT